MGSRAATERAARPETGVPMRSVCAAAPQLAGVVPYDPKYLPATAVLSANENPHDVDDEIRRDIMREVKRLPLNRYPDPLANDLRDMIAEANGLDRDQVLVGNGGDELLFNLALAWGGPGRTFLNLPPTFSVYDANARLTNTSVVDVPRRADFSIDDAHEVVVGEVLADDGSPSIGSEMNFCHGASFLKACCSPV